MVSLLTKLCLVKDICTYLTYVALKSAPKKRFRLVYNVSSEKNSDKKLDIQDNDNGVWYEDEYGAEVFVPNDEEI